MADNLLSTEQTTEMLTNMQNIAMERTGLPAFLSVDEEGGTVARVAANEAFGVTNVGNMSDIGALVMRRKHTMPALRSEPI